jgi:hypothetical protein
MGDMVNVYRILDRTPEWKGTLWRNRRKWENNIRMDLKEILSEDVDWIHLAHDRVQWWAVMNTVMNFRIP